MPTLSQQEQQESMPEQHKRMPLQANYANMPPPPQEDFFKYRLDPANTLEEIEHKLKGEVYDEHKGEYVEKYERWVNDEGINKVMGVIHSCGLSKEVFMGNLSKDEILFKCKAVKKQIAKLLFRNSNKYGIKREMRSLVVSIIVNNIHYGLSRAEGGRESDQISVAAQRHDIWQHEDKEKERNMPFFNFGRKW